MNLDYSPVLDEAGQPAGVLAVVIETTERVAAERATKQSEARLRAYVTATSDVLYRMSADWTQMYQLDGQGFVQDAERPTIDWIETYIDPEDQLRVRAGDSSRDRDEKYLSSWSIGFVVSMAASVGHFRAPFPLISSDNDNRRVVRRSLQHH